MSTAPIPKSISELTARALALEDRAKANRAKVAAYAVWSKWHGKTGARYRYCSLLARASAPEAMLKAISLARLTEAEQAEMAELGTTFLAHPWTVEVPTKKRTRRAKQPAEAAKESAKS